jgi:enterochelin esterase-like enzyme
MRLSILYIAVCAHAAAGIHSATFHSRLNGRDVTIQVYTPPGYETSGRRYPVVYNLHGGGGSPARQWERTGATLRDAIENGKIRPLIYVFAEGLGNTLYLDYPDGSLKVESMIVWELIPFIDRNYQTIASHEGRAIEGFSMGGYGALLIAFRYPALFSSAVSYGGAVLSPETVRIAPNNEQQFPTMDHYLANSPWGLVEKNKDRIIEHLRVRMVCGDADEKWYPGNVRLKERAEALKVPVAWVSVPGVGHDTKGLYERAGLESLQFIEEGFASPLDRPEGVIQDVVLRSEINRRNVWIKVYTPPGYEEGAQRYPVVYNLHGAGGGSPQRQWVRAGLTLKEGIETGKVQPAIYVFVDGLGDTFFLDYPDGSVKAESMIVRELIPFIDRNYRTIAARDGRAIEGFSMGGAGSLRLAIKYPDLFRSVVAYGAAVIKGDRAGVGDENLWVLVRNNADRIRGRLAIRMVCGDKDSLYVLNMEFRDLLRSLDIAVDWVSIPDVAHDTKGLYRRVGVESLRFMQAQRDASQLP